jgi:hypothetical protein
MQVLGLKFDRVCGGQMDGQVGIYLREKAVENGQKRWT